MEKEVMERGVALAVDHGARDVIVSEIEDAEKVFLAWVNDRSMTTRQLADATGVEYSKVRDMLRSGIMQRRYMEMTADFQQIARPYTEARVHEMVDDMLARMQQVIENGSDRDAIAAVRVLSGMISQPSQSIESHVTINDPKVIQIAQKGIESIEDIQRLVSAHIDGNNAIVQASRATKRK